MSSRFGRLAKSADLSVLGLWASLGLLTSACDIGTGLADFGSDVFEPKHQFIEGPGRRIASGQFSGPLIDPWGENGSVIVAFRHESDGPHLLMQPFDGSQGCELGRGRRCIVYNKLAGLKQLVAYLEQTDESGRGPLRFAGHDCTEAMAPIADANLPAAVFDDPPGYLVEAGGQLLDVAPWKKQIKPLAGQLRGWGFWEEKDKSFWFIDDGQFVVMNARREELFRGGKDVTEMVRFPTSSRFLLVDGGQLNHFQSFAAKAQLVATQVCSPRFQSGSKLSYFSPCDAGALIVADLTEGKKTPIDSGIRTIDGYYPSTTQGDTVFYSKPALAPADGMVLWMAQGESLPVPIAKHFVRLEAVVEQSPLSLLLLVGGDGQRASLVKWTSKGSSPVLDNVSLEYSGGLLANYDGQLGDLFVGAATSAPQRVAQGVPVVASPLRSQSTEFPVCPVALLTNAKDWVGTLALAEGYQASSADCPVLKQPKVTAIASGVPAASYQFFDKMPAIGFLENWNRESGTGQLALYNTELGAHNVIASDVREFIEMLWPNVGVLYVVPTGDNQGIWIARAK